ncbi:hypothetical protein J6590_029482 [Homalodisca vitripennis]|nr:hypothetical protein J6590_029482 [Homalodisca vitripennis]
MAGILMAFAPHAGPAKMDTMIATRSAEQIKLFPFEHGPRGQSPPSLPGGGGGGGQTLRPPGTGCRLASVPSTGRGRYLHKHRCRYPPLLTEPCSGLLETLNLFLFAR